jgi:hypothetical protein
MWLSFSGGKFKHSLNEPVIGGRENTGYVFRFEAEGYAPYISGKVPADAGVVRMDVTLRRRQSHAVMVKLPDGSPAAATEVGLVMPGAKLKLAPGWFGGSRGNQNLTALLKTDRNGVFELLPDATIQRVVAVHASGYAEETFATVMDSPTLQIKLWGRIEGEYVSDGIPQRGMEIRVQWQLGSPDTLMLDEQTFVTKTDEQGRFVFAKIPAGRMRLWRRVNSEPVNGVWSWEDIPLKQLEVRSGETTTVLLGGNTYRFSGKAVWPAEIPLEQQPPLHVVLMAPGTPPDAAYHNKPTYGFTILSQGPDGVWAGKNLVAGNYTLRVLGAATAPGTKQKKIYGGSKEIQLSEGDAAGVTDFGSVELKPERPW